MATLLTGTSVSPLRQRIQHDMLLRGLGSHTQQDYVRHVRRFATFLGRSPDTATPEDVRGFQLNQDENGIGPATINGAVSALRFLFLVTLKRRDLARALVIVRHPRKLPDVLSVEEAALLLAAAPGIKYKAALGVAYGAGLRVSEVAHLKVDDVDSTRMLLRVEQGKGRKDRNAMLSPQLLELLRLWWREGRRRGVMLPDGWLFPGRSCTDPISLRQLHRTVQEAAEVAGVDRQSYLDLLTSTLFNAPVYKTYGGLIAAGQFEPAGFAAPLDQKDIRLTLAIAEELRVPLPLESLLRDRFLTLMAHGGETLDWSAIGGLAARDAGVGTN